MVYCGTCGSLINEGEIYCPRCGSLINSSHVGVGTLTIKWEGQWMLFDAKIHVCVNGDTVGSYSFKKGFEVSVPITSEKMLIGVKCSIRSCQPVLNVNPALDYTLYLIYSRFTGGFDFVLCDHSGKRIM